MSGTFSTLLSGLTAPASEGTFHVLQVPGSSAYYAGRDSSGIAALLIKAPGPGRMVPLRLAGIEARFGLPCRVVEPGRPERTESLTAILCLAQGPGIEDYFARVVDLFIDVLGPLPDIPAVAASIKELVELFQKLRRPPRKPITGVVGELLVVAAAPDPSAALSAWRTDPEERYDFAAENLRVEAKASSTRKRVHSISAEQADPPTGVIGLLASVFVEQAGGGISLRQLLTLIECKLAFPADVMRLRTIVADTLGRDLLTALDWSFDLALAQSSLQWFDLRSVPAVRGPFPSGVSGVRFVSDLGGCKPVTRSIAKTLSATAMRLLPL